MVSPTAASGRPYGALAESAEPVTSITPLAAMETVSPATTVAFVPNHGSVIAPLTRSRMTTPVASVWQ
jgi:hypothetical protein